MGNCDQVLFSIFPPQRPNGIFHFRPTTRGTFQVRESPLTNALTNSYIQTFSLRGHLDPSFSNLVTGCSNRILPSAQRTYHPTTLEGGSLEISHGPR